MKKIIKALLTAFVIFSIVSCKDYEEDIIGVWNYQTFDNQPQGTVIFTFKENNLLIRMINKEDNIYFDSCQYLIEKSLLKTQINISGSKPNPGYTDIDGIYRIDKFKEDILIMTRERLSDDETAGAYLRCELIRRQ